MLPFKEQTCVTDLNGNMVTDEAEAAQSTLAALLEGISTFIPTSYLFSGYDLIHRASASVSNIHQECTYVNRDLLGIYYDFV